jgi:osmoprotectant transport system permease protein
MPLSVILLSVFSVSPCFISVPPAAAAEKPVVRVGSKAFAESWVLGEALTILARQSDEVTAEHVSNLGGTDIVYRALQKGDIDVYPEYTGTIAEVLLKAPGRPSLDPMRAALAKQGIGISDTLGFNDGYALAVMPATQKRYNLRKISDLARHPDLQLAFTHEFLERKDGYPGLARHYGLRMNNVRGIQHDLAYEAIRKGQIDVMEIYTTDAQIGRIGLEMLADDQDFFPRYDAVLLYRQDLPRRAPKAWAAMQRLVGTIDEARMIRANAQVVLEKKPFATAAAALLQEALGDVSPRPGSVAAQRPEPSAPLLASRSVPAEIARDTLKHLQLVALSLLPAILIGLPLGILATRSQFLAGATLATAGLLQTIPSLALLAFLIPWLGIREPPALVALFLYSLLPIVRNTYVGLTTIPPNLLEVGEALGLPRGAQLRRVRLPMASPAIMAGIKTSAVINVGTATLAGLIGAGGLGDPIWRGMQTLNPDLILQGVIPAAALALLVQWGFDHLDRLVIPRGLRLPGAK